LSYNYGAFNFAPVLSSFFSGHYSEDFDLFAGSHVNGRDWIHKCCFALLVSMRVSFIQVCIKYEESHEDRGIASRNGILPRPLLVGDLEQLFLPYLSVCFHPNSQRQHLLAIFKIQIYIKIWHIPYKLWQSFYTVPHCKDKLNRKQRNYFIMVYHTIF
jgi:hypothetical protein